MLHCDVLRAAAPGHESLYLVLPHPTVMYCVPDTVRCRWKHALLLFLKYFCAAVCAVHMVLEKYMKIVVV